MENSTCKLEVKTSKLNVNIPGSLEYFTLPQVCISKPLEVIVSDSVCTYAF